MEKLAWTLDKLMMMAGFSLFEQLPYWFGHQFSEDSDSLFVPDLQFLNVTHQTEVSISHA